MKRKPKGCLASTRNFIALSTTPYSGKWFHLKRGAMNGCRPCWFLCTMSYKQTCLVPVSYKDSGLKVLFTFQVWEFLWKNFYLARIKFSPQMLSRFCFPAGFSRWAPEILVGSRWDPGTCFTRVVPLWGLYFSFLSGQGRWLIKAADRDVELTTMNNSTSEDHHRLLDLLIICWTRWMNCGHRLFRNLR